MEENLLKKSCKKRIKIIFIAISAAACMSAAYGCGFSRGADEVRVSDSVNYGSHTADLARVVDYGGNEKVSDTPRDYRALGSDECITLSETIKEEGIAVIAQKVMTNSEAIAVENNSGEAAEVYLYNCAEPDFPIQQFTLQDNGVRAFTNLSASNLYNIGASRLSSRVVFEKNHLNLTGNGADDSLIITEEGISADGSSENSRIIVTIQPQSGLSASVTYGGSYEKYRVLAAFGKFNFEDRDSIVVEMMDGMSNYGSSSFHVLHAEQDGEELTLAEDLTILDRDSRAEAAAAENGLYKNSLFDLPEGFTITLTEEDDMITFMDGFKKNAIRINEWDSNAKSETAHYVYWTGDAWDFLDSEN